MAKTSDPQERIVIRHPDIEADSIVTRQQLEQVWAEQGFEEVKGADPDNPSPSPDALPPESDSEPPKAQTKPKNPPSSGGAK